MAVMADTPKVSSGITIADLSGLTTRRRVIFKSTMDPFQKWQSFVVLEATLVTDLQCVSVLSCGRAFETVVPNPTIAILHTDQLFLDVTTHRHFKSPF